LVTRCVEFFIAFFAPQHDLSVMSVPAKKRVSSARAPKPTRGTVMAAKLRAQCNDISDEQGEAAYLHAMSAIYGATQQTARTGH
jgi:hypothetical protein